MNIFEVIEYFEQIIPLDLQESYDNCGLQVGNIQQELTNALIAFDITEKTIAEAVEKNCNLILSHHP
ncbi:MAG TPA: Nif3-like dinuclear metal center hexameric protein, partial [Bacteroidales bacterium]|nr:Nif3-like dinuclear metal center hexameric protein [Bacteroidales bacterium]